MQTKHFLVRSQQRGLPPGVQRLLDDFGEIQYDGAGHAVTFLSKRSKRLMEKEWGKPYVARLGSWRDAYRVETSSGETQITTGFRRNRVRRR